MTQGLSVNELKKAGITPGDTVLVCAPASQAKRGE
jgi:hypothetical protein